MNQESGRGSGRPPIRLRRKRGTEIDQPAREPGRGHVPLRVERGPPLTAQVPDPRLAGEWVGEEEPVTHRPGGDRAAGWARSWDDPVPMTVTDAPESALVKVSLLPGKATICLTGSPAASMHVVMISRCHRCAPRTGKAHWSVMTMSS